MDVESAVVSKIKNLQDFKKFMDKFSIKSKVIVIKPNWVDAVDGFFTEAEVLELFFKYFEGKKIIVAESYTAWRNEPSTKGESRIPNQSDLNSTKPMWEWIKEQDNWFLETKKIQPLLEKYNVEYINITEEVWAGRVVATETIRKLVESKFSPLEFEEFYSYVPTRLFELKDAAFISLSKIKTEDKPFGVSASTKNLFGLIPDPSRYKYHAKNHEKIPQSILDINKVYRALFDCLFIVEGIFAGVSGYMGQSPKIIKDLRIIFGSKNSAQVDIQAAKFMKISPEDIEYLPPIIKTFG